MKKSTFLFLIFLLGLVCSSVCLKAQQRQVIEGLVLQDDIPLSNVLIKNINTGGYTISDNQGEFEIEVQEKDTLWLSHIGTSSLKKVIRKENIVSKILTLRLITKINELEEVVVENTSKIDAVSLGIIQSPIKEMTFNEKRLHSASKALSLYRGKLGVSLDAIINTFTGRTKRLRKVVANDRKIKQIEKVKKQNHQFLIKQLKLSDLDIERLLVIAMERPKIIKAVEADNQGEVQLYLIELWQEIQEK